MRCHVQWSCCSLQVYPKLMLDQENLQVSTNVKGPRRLSIDATTQNCLTFRAHIIVSNSGTWTFELANVIKFLVTRPVINLLISISQTVVSIISHYAVACVRPRKQRAHIRIPLQVAYTPSICALFIVWIVQSSPKVISQNIICSKKPLWR